MRNHPTKRRVTLKTQELSEEALRLLEELPPVPLTLEGSSVLHQMAKLRRPEWRRLTSGEQDAIIAEASAVLAEMEQRDSGDQSALYSLIGHKGDFLFLHFRKSFEGIKEAELKLAQLKLWDYLELTTSFLSVVELSLYDQTPEIYTKLAQKGIEPGTREWDEAIEQELAPLRQALQARLFPEIPPKKYVCFYPMGRRRGETKNWYQISILERQELMRGHGHIGMRYAGRVKQIISAAIGLDDWEWGVDLFADDPIVFKKLVYEMRFDEASAVYALFGPFYVGVRVPASELGRVLKAEMPEQ